MIGTLGVSSCVCDNAFFSQVQPGRQSSSSRTFGVARGVWVQAVAVDSTDNILVTGKPIRPIGSSAASIRHSTATVTALSCNSAQRATRCGAPILAVATFLPLAPQSACLLCRHRLVVAGTTGAPVGITIGPGGQNVPIGGDNQVFVTKINPSGEHVWTTYLGGTHDEIARDMVIDGGGNVFVTGDTESTGCVVGGFDTTYNGGNNDAFIAKLDASANHSWSSYIGGSDAFGDVCYSVALYAAGNSFVTGITHSADCVSRRFYVTYNAISIPTSSN